MPKKSRTQYSTSTSDIPRRVLTLRLPRGASKSKTVAPKEGPTNLTKDEQLRELENAVIYTRVSTVGQDSDAQGGAGAGPGAEAHYSQETQKDNCLTLATRMGLNVKGWMSFVGSAWKNQDVYLAKFKREILSFMKNNYLTKLVVLVRDASRFSRHGGAAVALINELRNKYNVRVFSVIQGDFLDNTACVLALMQANDESNTRSNIVRAGLKRARDRGTPMGRIRYGCHRRFDATLGRKVEEADEGELNIIRFIQICCQVGATVGEIWQKLKVITANQDNGVLLNTMIEPDSMSRVDVETIADILNEYRVLYRRGQPWTPRVLKSILRQLRIYLDDDDDQTGSKDPKGDDDDDDDMDDDGPKSKGKKGKDKGKDKGKGRRGGRREKMEEDDSPPRRRGFPQGISSPLTPPAAPPGPLSSVDLLSGFQKISLEHK